MTVKTNGANGTPAAQLRSFVDRFEPKSQKVFRAVRAALRKRFPAANELAYDYGHSVVIAYSPTERGIDGIVSISLLADEVRLYFMHGPQLPDPKRLLLGSAKQVRYVVAQIEVDLSTQVAYLDATPATGFDRRDLVQAGIPRATATVCPRPARRGEGKGEGPRAPTPLLPRLAQYVSPKP